MNSDIKSNTTPVLPDGIETSLQVHFAMQLCDSNSFQKQQRVCGDDRTALSQRSLMSFVDSVLVCARQRPLANFTVMLFVDNITASLRDFCHKVVNFDWASNLQISMNDISPATGISDSIRTCYQWMQDHGRQIVGQFQDDYLFVPQAISDSVDILLQVQKQSATDALIAPHHFAAFWREHYRNVSSPRCVMIGRNDYWIQIYDIACTFITTHTQFSQHWDLYDMFLELCRIYQYQGHDHGLESQSLNHMMTQRGVLALVPMRTLSHHVQSQRELDPFQDWQQLWDTIDIIKVQV